MSADVVQTEKPSAESPPVDSEVAYTPEPGSALFGWAIVFWITGFVFGIIGLIQMFNESKIVGGDAYNYIIGAMRGIGWICLGGLSGILGCALTLFSLRRRFGYYRDGSAPKDSSFLEKDKRNAPSTS